MDQARLFVPVQPHVAEFSGSQQDRLVPNRLKWTPFFGPRQREGSALPNPKKEQSHDPKMEEARRGVQGEGRVVGDPRGVHGPGVGGAVWNPPVADFLVEEAAA